MARAARLASITFAGSLPQGSEALARAHAWTGRKTPQPVHFHVPITEVDARFSD